MFQYQNLVKHILQTGTRKENRTGIDTISTFGAYYEHDMMNGFPLLTTKSVSWKNIVIEMLWFLSGQTDIAILKRHDCKFWDAWADENGKVPSAYRNFWRRFPIHKSNDEPDDPYHDACLHDELPGFSDQIAWVLSELQKNPMSRRMVVSAWAPENAQTSKLPPCHCMFVLNVQNTTSSPTSTKRLCLHLTQRSCDVALGVPYNLASYALLLHLFARFAGPESGIVPGIFGHSLVDAHIYTKKPDGAKAEFDHVPGLMEQCGRRPRALPTLHIDPQIRTLADVEALMAPGIPTEDVMKLFVLENYNPHPAIPFKVAV